MPTSIDGFNCFQEDYFSSIYDPQLSAEKLSDSSTSSDKIQKDLEQYLTSMQELLQQMNQPKEKFEFSHILSLLQEVIELQEQEGTMATYYFEQSHREKKNVRLERLNKMDEIANYAHSTRTFGIIATAASFLQTASTLSFTSPIGMVALPLAIGMALEKMLDDPIKRKLVQLVYGKDYEEAQETILSIDIGIGFLAAVVSCYQTVPANGWESWISSLSSTGQATLHTAKGYFGFQTKNAEAALTGHEEKMQVAVAKEKKINKEIERIMDNWLECHQSAHEILRRLSRVSSAILRA